MILITIIFFLIATSISSSIKYPIILPDDNGKLHLINVKDSISYVATIEDVTFYLHRRDNVTHVIPASDFQDRLSQTAFNQNLPSIFIIHGWNNDYKSGVNKLIKEAILEIYDLNVFVVDWGNPASGINYVSARASAIAVGHFVGDSINYMIKGLNYPTSFIFLAGYSLGAHSCGAAGARTGGKVHTIIGMDAAEPLFRYNDTDERLDPSDAQFVHVIHTCGALLGFEDPIGHADYYPNGGMLQSGCVLDPFGMCSHSMSYRYFAESITSSNFVARKCDNYENYKAGLCSKGNISLLGGFDVDRTASGTYYLDTNGKPPYGKG